MVFHAGTVRQGRRAPDLRRPRAVRDGAGRQRQGGAAARLRGHARHPFRRRAVPPRHRPSRRARGWHETHDQRRHRPRLPAGPAAAHRHGLRRSGRRHVRSSDKWKKGKGEPLQGDGITMILEDGKVFERAGCGFSHVRRAAAAALGHAAPARTGRRAASRRMGVSLVFHPRNPYAPTVHMNVRMLAAHARETGEPVSWFGGGMDLTPYYGFEEDAVHFHTVCKRRAGALRQRQVPALQDLVRRVFLPEAPQRAARHRRHLLRRFRRRRLR